MKARPTQRAADRARERPRAAHPDVAQALLEQHGRQRRRRDAGERGCELGIEVMASPPPDLPWCSAGGRECRPSIPLEPAHQLPVGDAAVVFELLPLGGVHVVLDHVVAERLAQHAWTCRGTRSPRAGSSGTSGSALPTIGVARERRLELELLLDAGEAGRDQRREGEIRVEVGAADAALDADRLAALAAQAEAGGAVVAAPDRLGRREGADLEALVGVDVGREEIGEVARIFELPGDEVRASAPTCRARPSASRNSGVLPAASHSDVWMWLDEPARS